jgi:predicted glycosyltransferase
MSFKIENGKGTTNENDLFLIGYGKDKGHYHTLNSVKELINSETFREYNSELIPIFEKALELMEQNKTVVFRNYYF